MPEEQVPAGVATPIEDILAEPVNEQEQFGEISDEVTEVDVLALQNTAPPIHTKLDKFIENVIRLASSGLFFIVFGCALLFVAYLAQKNDDVHSSFTFVLVVLAVAVILFGTGTQGAGTIQNGTQSNGAGFARASLAGGAGVIALLLGAGIVKFQEQIRHTFANTEQLYKVHLKLHNEGSGPIPMSDYIIEATWAGEQWPVLYQNGKLVVMVPKLRDHVSEMDIEIKIFRKKPSKDFKSEVIANLKIEKTEFGDNGTEVENRHGFRSFTTPRTLRAEFKTEIARSETSKVPNKKSDQSNSETAINNSVTPDEKSKYLEEVVVPSDPNGGLERDDFS